MASKGHEEIASLRPQLLAFARRRLRCPHLAEDAVQEAMVAALEGLERYAGDASLRTWLTGILKHKIVDAFRNAPAEEPLQDWSEALCSGDGGPEEACAARGELAALQRGLDGLPALHARAFVLREAMGMETREICDALAITPSHCWVLLHRARARLRALPDLAGLAGAGG
jgi:RNA polymerase sigma-70 factor (ECF subfamily)